MANEFACPSCGSPVDDQMKFCRSCGAPLEGAAVPAASEPAAADELVCPQCGTPAGSPNEKFCMECGAPLKPTATGAAAPRADGFVAMPAAYAAPTAAPTASAPVNSTPAVPAFGAPAGVGVTQPTGFDAAAMQSKLDDFMGATVDTSNVGIGFNPDAINLGQADDAAFKTAFAFFGKSFSPEGELAAVNTPEVIQRRDQARAKDEERAARRKEKQEFSARGSKIVQGEMASYLRSDLGPNPSMVQDVQAKAMKRQTVDRLKHKVALGDMSREEAIEQASEA